MVAFFQVCFTSNIVSLLLNPLCLNWKFEKLLCSEFFFFSCWYFCSVAQSCLTLWDPKDCSMPGLPCLSPPPGVCSNSRPLSRWCHSTISSSAAPFFCLQSFPTSGSFPMSWLFTSGGQSIGTSASASAFPMNIQGWFPLGLTCLIILSKGLSRAFSSTTDRKHQFWNYLSSECEIQFLVLRLILAQGLLEAELPDSSYYSSCLLGTLLLLDVYYQSGPSDVLRKRLCP